LVQTWKETLDLTFGPFNLSTPLPPVMFFTSAANKGTVRLQEDTTAASLTLTNLYQLGSGGVELDPNAVPAEVTLDVQQGTLLTVTVTAAGQGAAKAGLYQGLVLQANVPVAVVL